MPLRFLAGGWGKRSLDAALKALPMLKRMLPWLIFLGVTSAAIGSITLIPLLNTPHQEQLDCREAATKRPRQLMTCPTRVTLWERAQDDPMVLETLGLLAFTAVLAGVGIGQGWLLQGQLALGRDEFNATHRPRLHVRNFVVKPPSQGPGQMPLDPFHPGHPIHGQFYVANIGDADATIVESHCEIVWELRDLPMERPYEGKDANNPLPKCSIPSGASVPGLFYSDKPFGGLNFIENRSGLYVMGLVEYTDARKVRRRTAFCREYCYRHGSLRFYPVEDPDYEHEE